MSTASRATSCLFWPFAAVLHALIAVLRLIGGLIATLLGLIVTILGLLVSLTVIGAAIGIPLITFGFLLMMRGIFQERGRSGGSVRD